MRKLYLISVMARACRANDLAAAAVARCKDAQSEAKRRALSKHAGAEARKREHDREKQAKIRAQLHRITMARARRAELQAMRLLVAEDEAAATLALYRPPPVLVPYELNSSDEDAEAYIKYTPKHDDDAWDDEEEEDDEDDDDTTLLPSGLSLAALQMKIRDLDQRIHAATPMRPRRPEARAVQAEMAYELPYDLYSC